MAENLRVSDDIHLWVAEGKITLQADGGSALVEIPLDRIEILRAQLASAHLIAVEQDAAIPVVPGTPHDPTCPYTHSHTRAWCGYPLCRQS